MRYVHEERETPIEVWAFSGLHIRPHIHQQLELVYLTEGATVAALDGREFEMEAGDLFLSFPNQIHFYHDRGSTAGFIIIFSAGQFPDLAEVLNGHVPRDPVVPRERVPGDLCRRFPLIIRQIASGGSFDFIAGKGHILTLLGEILPHLELRALPAQPDSIKNILQYCMEKYTQPLTLDALARDMHLNKYYISHLFQSRLGMSFPEFINRLRLEHACERLCGQRSIVDVAFDAGFSSIRTFNRFFIEKMGMTPSEYIRQKKPALKSGR